MANTLGEVHMVNNAFLNAFGMRPQQRADAWKNVFGASDSTDEFHQSVRRSLGTTGEWKGLVPSGHIRPSGRSWFLTVSTIRSESNETTGFLALLVDLTERVHLESQIARNVRGAGVNEGALAVVQEVGTPAQDILMNILVLELYAEDAILGQRWSDAERATIHLITREARRLESILKGVLSYVRDVELRYEEVPISEFLEDIRGLLEGPAQRRNVHLTVEPERSNLMGRFDPDRMQQAVLGLLQDAVQTAEQSVRPSILLRAQEKKDPSWHSFGLSDRALVFEILGSGPGRSAQAQKELFQPCFTGTASDAARNLETSANIIRQHHGLLDIQPAGIQPFSTMYTIALPM